MKIIDRKPYALNDAGRPKRGHGSLVRYEGVANWYSVYCAPGGKEIRQSTHTSNLAVARRVHKRNLDAIGAARHTGKTFIGPANARVTMSTVLDDFEAHLKLRSLKSLDTVLYHLKPVRAAFGSRRLGDVTSSEIDKYIQARLAEGRKPATVNRETSVLAGALKLARERNQVGELPTIRHLRENNARRGFMRPEQFQAIATHLPAPYDDFARLCHMLGWRKSEPRSLTAANVDLRAGELRLDDSKNGNGRAVPLRDEHGKLTALGDLIERRMAARKVVEKDEHGEERTILVPWLFHIRGRQVGDFRKAWATACIAGGFSKPKLDEQGRPVLDRKGQPVAAPAFLFHDLRRSFAKDAIAAGNDPKTVMDIGGWKTVSVFHRYQIVDTRQMAKALSRLELVRTAPTATGTVVPLGRVVVKK